MESVAPVASITPRRKINRISAILLPLMENDTADWPAFDAHIQPTHDAGLPPAVNMTAPRNGIVSGCYPLDPFNKIMPERDALKAAKKKTLECAKHRQKEKRYAGFEQR